MERELPFDEWAETVPKGTRSEPVWSFIGYQKALYLYDLIWMDCDVLLRDPRGRSVAYQIIDSGGSISANTEEGYGRGFRGRERAQFLNYATASARETKGWYFRGRKMLDDELVERRMLLCDEVIALLVDQLKRARK